MKDYTKQVTEIFYTSLKAYVKMSIIAVHFSRLFNAPVVTSSSGSKFLLTPALLPSRLAAHNTTQFFL